MTTIKTSETYTSLVVNSQQTHSERNTFSERFQLSTLLVDFLVLNGCYVLGVVLYNNLITVQFQLDTWLALSISINCIWLMIAMYNDIYRWYEIVRPSRKVKNLLYVNGIFFTIISSLYYYIFYPILQSDFLLPVFSVFIIINILTHLFFRKHYINKMPIIQYIVVGGKIENINYIQEVFKSAYQGKSNCVGSFSRDSTSTVRWLGNYSNLKKFINNNYFHKLYYIYSDLTKSEIREIVELCESKFIDFEIIPREINIFSNVHTILQEEAFPILVKKKEPLQRLRNRLLKRVFDIVFSLLVILLLFPLLIPVVALFIKFESSGPIFFIQERTGYWNKRFKCLKFRTMLIHQEGAKYQQATKNDARITKIGSFLRRTNLDEFPQFINVLLGDMSIVGPRPHPIKLNEESNKVIKAYMIRHRVKPGITGWAQIHGHRGPTDTIDKMKSRVEFDAYYIKNWTLLKDIFCIWRTVVNMMVGEENAF